jgi:hypothetical protein
VLPRRAVQVMRSFAKGSSMKRALIPVLVVAALVAGCGSSSGSGSSGGGSGGSSVSTNTAAGVLAAAQSATKDAKSAAFDATMNVTVQGNLQGAGAGAALLQGPIKVELKGNAGKASDGKPKFDVHFALNFSGGSFSGEALSPDGKVLYLQMPALMGPGWRSLPLNGLTSSGSNGSGSSSSQGLAQLKALGVDPSKWLKNLTLQSSGGQDTISADLDLARLVADASKAGTSAITPKSQKQIQQFEHAVTKAHGSLSFDSSSHLPTDEALQFAMTLPKSMAAQANGLKALALDFDIKFSDWNKDFSVSAPAGAKPLNTGGLLGGLGTGA